MLRSISSARGRNLLGVGMAIGLAAGVASGAFARSAPRCAAAIAGTYYEAGLTIMTLEPDGSLIGQLSQTNQEGGAGNGETFLGHWSCDGTDITTQDFRFFVSGTSHLVSRVESTGTFDGGNTLALTFTFHVFDENASAADVRSADGTAFTLDPVDYLRVSTP